MKMVSQLTREAMKKHRLLASNVALSPHALPPADDRSAPAPQTGVYSAVPEPAQRPPARQPAPPRIQSVYSQLMKSHDRMTERHLRRT